MIFRKNNVKKLLLSQLIALAVTMPLPVLAAGDKQAVTFSRGFMNLYDSGIDLNQFNGVDRIIPGEYKLDVYGNFKKIDTWPVRFISADNADGVNACLTPEIIIRMNVDTDKLPENWKAQKCLILPELIAGATVTYDQEQEHLNVTVPQAMLLNVPEGYVSPELWDNGEPALMANYYLNASSNNNRTVGDETTSIYGNLQTSLALGAWRFTTFDALDAGSDTQDKGVEHIQAYASRAIAPLQSELQFGDLTTSGDFFDTLSLRGVRLATDDRMLPTSVHDYAPVVRGIANSNATVTIKQAGNTIYEKMVPPGEFAISDLYATGYNGDLEVLVKETNGKETTFIVPFASIPQLLREGYTRYAVTGGELRNTWLNDDPSLIEGTLQYGLLNNLTTYVGAQSAFDGDYNSLMTGIAINTSLGALGFDVTRSFTHFDNQPDSGECNRFCDMSLRISLAKNISQTGTNLSLMGYRYSSKSFYSLNDAIDLKRSIEADEPTYGPQRYRERLEANISQTLPVGWGAFYLSGFVGNYWNQESGHNESANFSVGYNNHIGSMSWGISYNRVNNEFGGHEDTFYLNMSMPLGNRANRRTNLGANFSYNSDETTIRTSLTGTGGERSQLGFGTYFSQSSRPDSNFGLNLSWNGDTANTGINYSQTRDNYMTGASISGAMVAHRGGFNFVPSLGDTIGIIEAPGAQGARAYPDSNAIIKDNGYGIVSYLSPYQYNDIYLDPKGTEMSVDIEDTRHKIVPTAGAAVLIKMETKQDVLTLVKITSMDADGIPFGASIFDEKNNNIGMTGQGGLAMVALQEGDNTLTVKWKKNQADKGCQAHINYSAAPQQKGSQHLSAIPLRCKDAGDKL